MMPKPTVRENVPERLLIVGASGFVGSRLGSAAGRDFTVIRGSRNPPAADDAVAIDIAEADSVRAAFDKSRPDVVVLLAALSDIDRCERERDLAERINYFGARNVARECAARGLRLLYTSTDAVFDGTKHIYYEHDEPTPVNWYGQTKARAERTVSELTPSAAIVRLSLVLGRGAGTPGNSYLEKVIGNLKTGNQIVTPTFEFRNPIDVATLCEFLLELAPRRESTGIFHIGASDKMSRYDLARAIAIHLGFDAALIVPQQEPSPDRAPRGRDDFLVTERLRAVCRTPVPTCQEVIERACHAVA
jgi:dTDP-4-dehydrorhamnose reductase